jgi:hypothetical protein
MTLTPGEITLIGLLCGVMSIMIISIHKNTKYNEDGFINMIVPPLCFILLMIAIVFTIGGLFYYINVNFPPAPGHHYGFELITGEI